MGHRNKNRISQNRINEREEKEKERDKKKKELAHEVQGGGARRGISSLLPPRLRSTPTNATDALRFNHRSECLA